MWLPLNQHLTPPRPLFSFDSLSSFRCVCFVTSSYSNVTFWLAKATRKLMTSQFAPRLMRWEVAVVSCITVVEGWMNMKHIKIYIFSITHIPNHNLSYTYLTWCTLGVPCIWHILLAICKFLFCYLCYEQARLNIPRVNTNIFRTVSINISASDNIEIYSILAKSKDVCKNWDRPVHPIQSKL